MYAMLHQISMTLYCPPCFYTNDVVDDTIATTDLPNVLLSLSAECCPDDVTLTSM